MEKRNAIAVVILVFSIVFSLWYLISTGAIRNPFVKYLNVKVSAPVSCELGYCWWVEDFRLEYSTNTLSWQTYAWWCGPFGGVKNLKGTIEIQNPDLSTSTSMQEKGTCRGEDVIFNFAVPLDKGTGNYDIKATVCGDASALPFFERWVCKTKEAIYYYGGQ